MGGSDGELVPPLPAPDDPMLRVLVEGTLELLRSGELTAEQAVLHAAVNGWAEGHLYAELNECRCQDEAFESEP